MTSHSRLSSIGLAAVLLVLVFAVAVPVGAQDTTIGLTVVVEPEAPYFGASVDFTITVEAFGGAVSEVAVQVFLACWEASGPTELSGNGDDILEPGEQWEYTCHQESVVHGDLQVIVTGVDGVGGDVSEELLFDCGALIPFNIGITTSTPEVYPDEEVTWEVLVGNDGPYALINVEAEARLNRSGPYSRMAGPVEKSGNGDDLLDPGELWEYHWSAVLWQDSFLTVLIRGTPEHSLGGGVGWNAESDVVIVIADSPPPESTTTVAATSTEDTLPRTGPNEPLKRLGALGVALLLFGVATLAGAAVLGKHRRQ